MDFKLLNIKLDDLEVYLEMRGVERKQQRGERERTLPIIFRSLRITWITYERVKRKRQRDKERD